MLALALSWKQLDGIRPAVEEGIERREPRDECAGPALHIVRMRELLPLDTYLRLGESIGVEVMARTAHPAEERVGADRLAEVEQQPRTGALDGNVRAARDRRVDLEGREQELEHLVVEADQAMPAGLEDLLDRRPIPVEVR